MAEFGKIPPRSPESFGVAGILGEGCHVFYENIFSTRHLGRVSDLLSARLKKAGPDELRLRSLLLYSVFEAFKTQVVNLNGENLTHPLTVECGIDDEKIAVGVAFQAPDGSGPKIDGLAERIRAKSGGDEFDALLRYLFDHAHRLIVRHQSDTRRFEIVSLIGLPGKMESEVHPDNKEIQVILISSNAEAPKPQAYLELGDIDYGKLLEEDAPGKAKPQTSSGEILVKATEIKKDDSSTKLEGKSDEDLSQTKIKGQKNEDEHVTRIKGDQAETQDQSVIKVKGSPTPEGSQINAPISTGSVTEKSDYQNSSGNGDRVVQTNATQVKLYADRIEELQKKIAELEAEKSSNKTTVSGTQFAQADATMTVVSGNSSAGTDAATISTESNKNSEEGGITGLIKKIWPFNKKKSQESQEHAQSNPGSEQEGEIDPALKMKEALASAGASGEAEDKIDNPESAAKVLMNEIEAGKISHTINKAMVEADNVKKEMRSARAKQWVDGLVGDLVAEKAKLHELAKKITMSVRQKELEFRNKELAYKEEIKRKDDMIKQKGFAATRLKDQVDQMTVELEKAKLDGKAGSEDASFKQKYNHVQKLLNSVKDEKANLAKKVEDLRSQLATAQMTAKTRGPSLQDFTAIQGKYERATRQAEEFKRVNQSLMEKLNDGSKKDKANPETEEIKKRLDATMRSVQVMKKEQEKLTQKLKDVERAEMRAKSELARLQAENKALKSGSNKAMGTTGAKGASTVPGASAHKPTGGTGGTPPKAA